MRVRETQNEVFFAGPDRTKEPVFGEKSHVLPELTSQAEINARSRSASMLDKLICRLDLWLWAETVGLFQHKQSRFTTSPSGSAFDYVKSRLALRRNW